MWVLNTVTFWVLGERLLKAFFCARVCAEMFVEGDGELPAAQLPLLICSNFISIC